MACTLAHTAVAALMLVACVDPAEDESQGSASATAQPEESGQRPGPPCPGTDYALVLGTLEEIGASCASLRIDEVVHKDTLLDEPSVAVGEVVRGRAGTVYAWKHSFELGDSLAAIVNFRLPEIVDGGLARPGPPTISLFAFSDERVQIQWGRVVLSAELDELTAPSCTQVLEARRAASTDFVPQTMTTTTTTTAAPPLESATCE